MMRPAVKISGLWVAHDPARIDDRFQAMTAATSWPHWRGMATVLEPIPLGLGRNHPIAAIPAPDQTKPINYGKQEYCFLCYRGILK
jgi:hypothetical protein